MADETKEAGFLNVTLDGKSRMEIVILDRDRDGQPFFAFRHVRSGVEGWTEDWRTGWQYNLHDHYRAVHARMNSRHNEWA